MKLELLWICLSLVSGFTTGPRSSITRSSFSSPFVPAYPRDDDHNYNHNKNNNSNRHDHSRKFHHFETLWKYQFIRKQHVGNFHLLKLSASTSSSAVPFSSSKAMESDTNFANVEATSTIQVINNHNPKNKQMEYKQHMDDQGRKKVHSTNTRNQTKMKYPTSDPEFLMKRTLQITSKHERFASSTPVSILRSVHWLMDGWNKVHVSDKIPRHVKLSYIQNLFDSLEELYHVQPTTKTWARLIKAYGQEKGGQYAMEILHQMPTKERNVHCYAQVLDSFAHDIMVMKSEGQYCKNGPMDHSLQLSSSQDQSLAKVAQELLQQMIDRDHLPSPNARCFHAVIRAWGHECNPPAAQACMSLMQTLYSQGKIDEPPNRYCYNAVIYAWANAGQEWNAEMAEELLHQMSKDAHVHPNIVSYNLCIAAWAKSGNGERAEQILRNMDSSEDDRRGHCKPNSMTYNTVMNAYAKSSDVNAAENAERLLSEMKNRMDKEGIHSRVKPDFFSFSTVINAWGRSLNSAKVDKVMKILNEMEKEYDIRPNVVIFNTILNACAYTFGDATLQRNAMETATLLLRKLDESNYDSPDHITYGTFLKVCLNQMIPGSMQSQIVKIIFLKCAKDGMVSQLVLDQMRSFSNSEMFQELLGFSPTDKSKGLKELPESWRRNVVEGKRRRM